MNSVGINPLLYSNKYKSANPSTVFSYNLFSGVELSITSFCFISVFSLVLTSM